MKKKTESSRAAILRKKRARRRAATLISVLTLIVLSVLSLTVFFNITTIEISGRSAVYSKEEILENVDVAIGDNMFLFSASKAAEDLWTKLPYLDSVKIRRQLPGTVVIDISDSEYSLILPYAGGSLILSDSLKIVENTATPPDGYTMVYGFQPSVFAVGRQLATESEYGTQYLEELVDTLREYGLLESTTMINVADRLNLSLVYEDRLFVMVGTASKLDYKIRMLRELVDDKLGADETGNIDLSLAGKATFSSGALTLPDGYTAIAEPG